MEGISHDIDHQIMLQVGSKKHVLHCANKDMLKSIEGALCMDIQVKVNGDKIVSFEHVKVDEWNAEDIDMPPLVLCNQIY